MASDFRFEIPDDLHLGVSHTDPGAFSPNLFDKDNNLAGQIALFISDKAEEELSEVEFTSDQGRAIIAAALGLAAGVLGTMAVVKWGPSVKTWMNDRALPSLHSRWRAIFQTPAPQIEAFPTTEVATVEAITPLEFSRTIESAFAESDNAMSSAEAQARRIMVLMAAAFMAEQMRALANAHIEEDEVAVLELENAMATLTSQPTTDSINRMLEANPHLVNDEVSAELMRVFGGGVFVDDQYVRIENGRMKEVLRLADGEAGDSYKPMRAFPEGE